MKIFAIKKLTEFTYQLRLFLFCSGGLGLRRGERGPRRGRGTSGEIVKLFLISYGETLCCYIGGREGSAGRRGGGGLATAAGGGGGLGGRGHAGRGGEERCGYFCGKTLMFKSVFGKLLEHSLARRLHRKLGYRAGPQLSPAKK